MSNKQSKVSWEQFIRLKCFLQYFTLKESDLIDIWIKILDPHAIRHVPTDTLLDFLEVLARGTITEEQTLVSKEYAKNMLKLWEAEGCLNENGTEIMMDKVE